MSLKVIIAVYLAIVFGGPEIVGLFTDDVPEWILKIIFCSIASYIFFSHKDMKTANDSPAFILGFLIFIYFIYCIYDSYTTLNSQYYSFFKRISYTFFDSYDSIVMFVTFMIFSKKDDTMPIELCGTWVNKKNGDTLDITHFTMNNNEIKEMKGRHDTSNTVLNNKNKDDIMEEAYITFSDSKIKNKLLRWGKYYDKNGEKVPWLQIDDGDIYYKKK